MYTVAVTQGFIAQHYLIGGDWGPENRLNSHRFRVEIRLEGAALDQHGYLVDIVAIKEALGEVVERYSDVTLNDLPEFAGLNPSVENFVRILSEFIEQRIPTATLSVMTVRLWEADDAWASYRREFAH